MGTDIHAYVEVRDKETGEWVFRHKIYDEWRDYVWFGILLDNMRGINYECSLEERGMPMDASLVVRKEFEGWGHSPSWISWKELPELWTNHLRILDEEYNDNILKQTVQEAAGTTPNWTKEAHKQIREYCSSRFSKEKPDVQLQFLDLISEYLIHLDHTKPDVIEIELDKSRWWDDLRIVFFFDS